MVASSCRFQERVFPVISENLYKLNFEQAELTGDRQAACNILSLVKEKNSGDHLNFLNQFGSLLRQHQLAIEAELASKWQRADFCWRQVQIEFKALSKRHEVWQKLAVAVASHPEATVMNEPTQLRQRLLHELFIDTHCAFYNGLISKTTKPSWKERAFVHIDYIQQLLEFAIFSSEEVRSLLGEAWQTRISACKETKKWRLAINYCQTRLKYLPNDIEFQGELVEVYYLATLAKLQEATTDSHYSKNAKRLLTGIQTLEKYLKNYPYNLTIFELLGSLYYLRAICLTNTSSFALGLLCIQKSITYNPYFQKAFETRDALIETMKQLQEQVNQLQVDIRQGMQLTPKGQQMVAEANQGFAPMNVYIDSNEAKETANDFYIAEAVYIWHKIGLPTPPKGWQKELPAGAMHTANSSTIPIESTSSWTRKALELRDAVGKVLQNPPLSKANLAGLWEWAIVDKPDLAELDADVICAFLERKLFEEESDRVLVTPPTGTTTKISLLTPIYVQRQPGAEPFLPWLLSSQDKRIKLQAVVATVLVAITGYVVMRERTTAAVREQSYQQVIAAENLLNDRQVLEAAENFLNNASLIKKDARTSQVMELYTKSFVRWFSQQPKTQLNETAQKHLEQYRQLQNTMKIEGN